MFDYFDVFCTVYLNNILIYLSDFRKYKLHVKQVLKQLRKAGLQIDIKKLKFSVTSIKYLKFIVFTENVTTNSQKIEIIKN